MKMLKRLLQVGAICSLLIFVSCQNNPQQQISQLEQAIEQLDKNGDNYNEQQIKDANNKIVKLFNEIKANYDKLSAEQKEEITKQLAKYVSLASKYGFSNLIDKGMNGLDDLKNSAKSIFDKAKDKTQEAIDNASDKIKDTYDNAKDKTEKVIENASDKIKDTYDNAKDKTEETIDKVKEKIK